ncbi:EAL domain-containing protein [Kineococcus sp. NBC_00420]|uniref:putative bifunctional diguanylate cyclase/phosphodiesterase n=1 Tax=Kineococcus sp. NBC_00420 TaxID=2903564 RepID=UPI002E20C036
MLLLALLAVVPAGRAETSLYLAGMLAALTALAVRVVVVPAGRGVWALLAAGAAVLLGGQALLLDASDGSSQVLPSAVQEHAVWALAGLGAYPLLYAAQMALLRQRVQRLLPSAWLDGVITTVLLMALAQAFVVPDLQARTGLGTLAASALVGRIALDLLMLSFALANAAMVGWRSDRRLGLVAAAFALLLLADVAGVGRLTGLLVHPLLGNPLVGPSVDAARFAALVLLTSASWRRPAPPTQVVAEGWPVLLAPTLALLGSVTLLGVHLRTPLPALAAELSLLTILLIGIKVLVVFREVLRLADSHRLALSDELTGLANRRALLQRLSTLSIDRAGAEHADRRAVVGRSGPQSAGALLVIDLDHFKDVNDSLGHQYGDDLLRQVATRMAAVLPPAALLARLGGDEFAVLVPEVGLGQGERIAERLLQTLGAPFPLGALSAHVGASIGIAVWPFTCLGPGTGSGFGFAPPAEQQGRDDAGDDSPDGLSDDSQHEVGAELLRRADAAMYTAKRAGGGTARYDEATGQAARQRLQRVEQLRTGITGGELIAYYQPQVDVRTGAVVGMEALVRWAHPQLGVLAPVHFVELAEAHGLMSELTTVVLSQAVQQTAAWHAAGFPLRIAVNLATSCLVNPDLVPLVDQVLADSGLPATALVLEITETTLMSDPDTSRATIEDLLRRGVAVSIDDYGTGYSSLAYLQDLSAVELKLDRAFTLRLASENPAGGTAGNSAGGVGVEGGRTAAIIAGTVELAHSLGMRLLVEGVEDVATLQRLSELGVDETQGYHHARPMPAAEVLPWLNVHQRQRRTTASAIPQKRTDGRVVLQEQPAPAPEVV